MKDDMTEAMLKAVSALRVSAQMLQIEAERHRQEHRAGHAEPDEGQAKYNREVAAELEMFTE